jgi:multiple sugar transport system substrate-binding protein
MSMPHYRGLTWDHPRGYNALAAAAAQADGITLAWDKHPLEGFESHPIGDLCARYDLVVLDHPHVGEAVAADCLMPIEELFGADAIAAWRAAVAGPSLSSYHYAGRHWALPLDAATQVMAYRRETVSLPPLEWAQLPAFAADHAVALSLAGPHAILSFQSICGALGFDPAVPRDTFMDRAIAREAYALMAALTGDVTRRARALNPIAMLGAIERGEGIDLCPLIYGYVNYATRGVGFTNAPAGPDGRIGSTLGGTGIGVSKRCTVTLELIDHLRWLMSEPIQRGFIPQHEGQPALRSAWADDAINAATGGFFAATLATVESALLRPRHDGAIAFQTAASTRLRAGLLDGDAANAVLDDLETFYRSHHPAGAET